VIGWWRTCYSRRGKPSRIPIDRAKSPALTCIRDPARERFYAWLMAEYNVSESTAKSYLIVVTRLGALESRRNGALTITAFGEKVLMAEPGDKARIVIERFMRDYLAFPEVLAVYDKADEAIHLSEMVEAPQPSFPRWTA
jgi:hypothetical protein